VPKNRKKAYRYALTYAPHVTIRRRKLTDLAVEKLHEHFTAGDEGALLDAIDFCARAGMAMPVWVVDAYCARYENWRMFRAKTLDAAFKVRRKKKLQLAKAERREWLKPRVVFELLFLQQERADQGKDPLPIDDHLFERVGKKLKISRAQANRLYYVDDNPWRQILPHAKRLLRKSEMP
jgi:hypothetical protein